MRHLSLMMLGLALLLSTIACEPAGNDKNVVQQAQETESLSTLVSAVQAAGLAETLSGEGPFTVFAPTNAAFEALPEGTLDMLLKPENKDQLAAILKYHVVSGKIMSGDLEDGQTAATVQGEEITVSTAGGAKINGASVTTADVEVSNGVVHIIDQVILPPSVVAEMEAAANGKTVVELAVETESLSTLVAAVQAAGLVETLNGGGPFTVFAPTNDAFAALPDGTLDMLLKPENKDKLTAILTYHVVPGKVMSTDLSDGQTAGTVQGDNVVVDLSDGVKINGATVTAADVEASNGVVHIIDKVILPPSLDM
ncbi:MAG: fasciclin domain-containing protein [Bacteroidota bacterium]